MALHSVYYVQQQKTTGQNKGRTHERMYTMKYAIVTETGKEIKIFDTERAAERFWDSLNGIWTDYDNNDAEYNIYIAAVAE